MHRAAYLRSTENSSKWLSICVHMFRQKGKEKIKTNMHDPSDSLCLCATWCLSNARIINKKKVVIHVSIWWHWLIYFIESIFLWFLRKRSNTISMRAPSIPIAYTIAMHTILYWTMATKTIQLQWWRSHKKSNMPFGINKACVCEWVWFERVHV